MIKKEVGALLIEINHYYPNFDVTQEKINDWDRALANCDNNRVHFNLEKYIKESKFPPTPAVLMVNAEIRQAKVDYGSKMEQWERESATPEQIKAIASKSKWGNRQDEFTIDTE